jgi:hypothetical protein
VVLQLGVGLGLTTPHHLKNSMLRNFILDQWGVFVTMVMNLQIP